MVDKVMIFDSGPLINLTSNGLLYLLNKMKEQFKGKFIITRQVKSEVIDRPMNVKRFELSALRVQTLIDEKILELPEALGFSDQEIQSKTQELMNKANHVVEVRGRWVKIVSDAEMSCLALSAILKKKNVESLIAVDERTTRVISEKPSKLEKLMSVKLHQNVKIKSQDLSVFEGFKFVRSPELVYIAWKKGLIKISGKKVLEAALYATKFKGAAISFEEIDQLRKAK